MNLTTKEVEVFTKHIGGWVSKDNGPWLRTIRTGSSEGIHGRLIHHAHGNTIRSMEDKGLVAASRVNNFLLEAILTSEGEAMARELGIDMEPPS